MVEFIELTQPRTARRYTWLPQETSRFDLYHELIIQILLILTPHYLLLRVAAKTESQLFVEVKVLARLGRREGPPMKSTT